VIAGVRVRDVAAESTPFGAAPRTRPGPGYQDLPVPSGRLWATVLAPSLAIHLPVTLFGAHPMLKHYAERAWRLAITVGPLVAVALSLVAGQKWR
jgi:hypothetical protein